MLSSALPVLGRQEGGLGRTRWSLHTQHCSGSCYKQDQSPSPAEKGRSDVPGLYLED